MASEQATELKRCLDEAFRAFESGDDETARQLCRKALSIDPDSSTAHSLMGLLYEREGRLPEATGEFETVLEQNPRSRAERGTLRRLRDEVDEEPEADQQPAEPAAERRWLAFVVPAVAALLVLVSTVAIVNRLNNRDLRVAESQSIEADLEAARAAFNRGDYQVAADFAQKVLNVQPEHVEARTIYDRSMAFLRGAQTAPPASREAYAQNQYGNTPPAQVQSQPVFGPEGVAAGAAPQAGAPNVGAAGNAPRRVEPQYTQTPTIPPLTVPLGGYAPGQPYTTGPQQPTRAVRPGASPYALSNQLRRTPPPGRGGGSIDQMPGEGPNQPNQPSQPTTQTQPARPGPIVTVRPGSEVAGGGASPEVAPGDGPSAGQGEAAAPPVDPAVERFRREQEALRQQRERQRAAGARRIESR